MWLTQMKLILGFISSLFLIQSPDTIIPLHEPLFDPTAQHRHAIVPAERLQRHGRRRQQCRRRGRVPFAALIRVGRPAARRSPFDTVRVEPDEGGLFVGVAGAHAAGVQFGRRVRVQGVGQVPRDRRRPVGVTDGGAHPATRRRRCLRIGRVGGTEHLAARVAGTGPATAPARPRRIHRRSHLQTALAGRRVGRRRRLRCLDVSPSRCHWAAAAETASV